MAEETPSRPIFLDMSTGNHLALLVSPSDTVADLKKNISVEHATCFADVGALKITALKVKRKGTFYHLSDSILVNDVFQGVKGNWFLQVDASVVEDDKPKVSVDDIAVAESDRVVGLNGIGVNLGELKVGLNQNGDENNADSVVKSKDSDDWLDNVVSRVLSSKKPNEEAAFDVDIRQLNENKVQSGGIVAEKDGVRMAFYPLEVDSDNENFVLEPRDTNNKRMEITGVERDELAKEHEIMEKGVVDAQESEPLLNIAELKGAHNSKKKTKKHKRSDGVTVEGIDIQQVLKNHEEKEYDPTIVIEEANKHDKDENKEELLAKDGLENLNKMTFGEDNVDRRKKKKSQHFAAFEGNPFHESIEIDEQNRTNNELIFENDVKSPNSKKRKRPKKQKQTEELQSDQREKLNEIEAEINEEPTFNAVVDVMINELNDNPTEAKSSQADQPKKGKMPSKRNKILSNASDSPVPTGKETRSKKTKKKDEALFIMGSSANSGRDQSEGSTWDS